MSTIREVAEAAGVSVSTASKGLHGKGRMREDTRQRILASARHLGFRPNVNTSPAPDADHLTIGLLTRDGYSRFTPPLLGGMEDALAASMGSLLLCDARRDAVRERHYLDALTSKRVDGLIVTGRATDPVRSVTARMPFPVVYAYATSDDPDDTSITSDDEHGGYLAARQMMRQGCTSLLYITGPEKLLAVRERIAGARRALAEHGLDLPADRILHTAFTEKAAFETVAQLLRTFPDVNGIMCGNDQLARGVADRLGGMKVSIPDDVALIGFDNWTLLASNTRPPLTSVDMNLYELGHQAGLAMLRAIDSGTTPGLTRISCELAIRESCPAPPGSDPVWSSAAPMIPDA